MPGAARGWASLSRYNEWFKTIEATVRHEMQKMWPQRLNGHNSREHRVLKIQEQMYKMLALLSIYPDAIVIQPHRDPTTVIASLRS